MQSFYVANWEINDTHIARVSIQGRRGFPVSGYVDMDLEVLSLFIQVYCEKKHGSAEKFHWEPSGKFKDLGLPPSPLLCKDCLDLIEYSSNRRMLCSLDPKPTCRNCETHWYQGDYRDRIREVMRFSGKHFLVYALRHGLFRESWEIITHFI